MTAKDVLKLAKEKGARIVDLRFIDLPGLWQHFSIPVSELNEEIFEDGLGFDGSSIRGFQTIDESDMLLIPDPNSAVMDPFTAVPTLVVICNVKDPVTGKWYTRDPRYIAQKAEAHLKNQAAAGRPLDRAGQSREEPRLATQGRRVYAGRHRDVDRVQAEARSRRGAAPPAPLGVRALLRYLIVIRGSVAARSLGALVASAPRAACGCQLLRKEGGAGRRIQRGERFRD